MRTLSISTVLLSAVSLSACVSASSPPSFGQMEQKYLPLAEEVYIIAATGNTGYANLPKGSVGHYSGLLLSTDHFCQSTDDAPCGSKVGYSYYGPKVEYIAKLLLELDFDNSQVTGSLSEFVTKLDNFKNPAGTIPLTGKICDKGTLGSGACDDTEPDGLAYIAFEGGGELLSANGNLAFYWFKAGSPSGADLGADGTFGGNIGQVIVGDFGSDFQWLEGIYVGISGSDGDWVAIAK